MAARIHLGHILCLFFALSLFFLLTVNLESTPPIGWDEGWTLTVARTWVERGYYSRLLSGQIVPRGLEAAFPTTATVALSFRLLGVGLWQGRLVAVVFTLAELGLLHFLATHLHTQKVARWTLGVLLLFSMNPQTNPLVEGRQALAEPAMLFFMLSGYVCLLLTLKKSLWFFPVVLLLWGIGLNSKAQAEPFWLVSLVAPLVMTVLTRRWAKSALLAVAIIGSVEVSQLLVELQAAWVPASVQSSASVTGMNEAVAMVPDLENRLYGIQTVLMYELPTVLGLAHAAWRWREMLGKAEFDFDSVVVELALLILAASWLAWYLFFANAGIYRYLFPPTFVGSMFVASLLSDLTDSFDFRGTVKRCSEAVEKLRITRDSTRALLAVMLPAIAVPVAVLMLAYVHFVDRDTSAQRMAQYLNTQTPRDAIIESYNSELFFFLNRRYHYPPDQASVWLVRQNFDSSATVNYDPLAADPDYLVLGPSPFSSGWSIYDQVVSSRAFKLIKQYGSYKLYERIR